MRSHYSIAHFARRENLADEALGNACIVPDLPETRQPRKSGIVGTQIALE
jgi:hypothetical protein